MTAKTFNGLITVAKTFNDIRKFNPYHDRRGRFTTANGASSFTWRTNDPSQQHLADNAIGREKKRSLMTRDVHSRMANTMGEKHYNAFMDKVDACQNENLKALMHTSAVQDRVCMLNAGDETSFFHHKYNAVFLDNEDSAGLGLGDDGHEPYQVAAHEYGHALDHNIGGDKPLSVKDGILAKALAKDFDNILLMRRAEMEEDIKGHETDPYWLFPKYIDNDTFFEMRDAQKRGLPVKPYQLDNRDVRRAGRVEFEQTLENLYRNSPRSVSCISDMASGISFGTIKAPWIHPDEYWSRTFSLYGGLNDGAAMEAFAHITEAELTNPAALGLIKQYFPETYSAYNSILEDAASNLV